MVIYTSPPVCLSPQIQEWARGSYVPKLAPYWRFTNLRKNIKKKKIEKEMRLGFLNAQRGARTRSLGIVIIT